MLYLGEGSKPLFARDDITVNQRRDEEEEEDHRSPSNDAKEVEKVGGDRSPPRRDASPSSNSVSVLVLDS